MCFCTINSIKVSSIKTKNSILYKFVKNLSYNRIWNKKKKNVQISIMNFKKLHRLKLKYYLHKIKLFLFVKPTKKKKTKTKTIENEVVFQLKVLFLFM